MISTAAATVIMALQAKSEEEARSRLARARLAAEQSRPKVAAQASSPCQRSNLRLYILPSKRGKIAGAKTRIFSVGSQDEKEFLIPRPRVLAVSEIEVCK